MIFLSPSALAEAEHMKKLAAARLVSFAAGVTEIAFGVATSNIGAAIAGLIMCALQVPQAPRFHLR